MYEANFFRKISLRTKAHTRTRWVGNLGGGLISACLLYLYTIQHFKQARQRGQGHTTN